MSTTSQRELTMLSALEPTARRIINIALGMGVPLADAIRIFFERYTELQQQYANRQWCGTRISFVYQSELMGADEDSFKDEETRHDAS